MRTAPAATPRQRKEEDISMMTKKYAALMRNDIIRISAVRQARHFSSPHRSLIERHFMMALTRLTRRRAAPSLLLASASPSCAPRPAPLHHFAQVRLFDTTCRRAPKVNIFHANFNALIFYCDYEMIAAISHDGFTGKPFHWRLSRLPHDASYFDAGE